MIAVRKWLAKGLNKRLESAGSDLRVSVNEAPTPANYFIDGECMSSGYATYRETKTFVDIALGK